MTNQLKFVVIAFFLLLQSASAQQQPAPSVDEAVRSLEQATETLQKAVQTLKTLVQPPAPPPCTYSVAAPATFPLPDVGGVSSDLVSVTTAANCTWTAVSADPWLEVVPGSMTGPGSVTVSASLNTTGTRRTGTLMIAGTQVVVTQDSVPPPPPPNPTDAASFAAALLKGGTIKLMPNTKIVGNFTVSVDGTRIEGLSLPTGRIVDGAASSIVIEGSPTVPPPGILPQPTIWVTANNVTITGIEVHTGAGHKNQAAVKAGSTTTLTAISQPDNFVLDHTQIKPVPGATQKGVELHTRKATVTNNRIEGFLLTGADSQAIVGWNGPGPYLIEDNYLEGSGENVMFGGGTTTAPELIPSDGVIRNNDFFKPQAWRNVSGSVKNWLEFKCARRWLVEGNRFDGMWTSAQAGNGVVLTPRNQTGKSPWTVVEDITIQNNTFKNHTGGYTFSILGRDDVYPSERTKRITIRGNLATSPKGVMVLQGVDESLIIDHNTWPSISGNLVSFEGSILTPLMFTFNVAKLGAYGFSGPCCSPGTAVIAAYTAPGSIITNNVLEKTPVRSIPMPAGNIMLNPGELAAKLDPVTFKYLSGVYGY